MCLSHRVISAAPPAMAVATVWAGHFPAPGGSPRGTSLTCCEITGCPLPPCSLQKGEFTLSLHLLQVVHAHCPQTDSAELWMWGGSVKVEVPVPLVGDFSSCPLQPGDRAGWKGEEVKATMGQGNERRSSSGSGGNPRALCSLALITGRGHSTAQASPLTPA